MNGISFVMFDEAQGKNADGSTKTIYIGISEKSDNLQVSNDGGATWKAISGGPANLMPHRAKIVGGDMYITYAVRARTISAAVRSTSTTLRAARGKISPRAIR